MNGKTDIKQFHLDNPATSFDYLEKIFQIPFVLKPLNTDGRFKLIRSQTEVKIEESKVISDTSIVFRGDELPIAHLQTQQTIVPKVTASRDSTQNDISLQTSKLQQEAVVKIETQKKEDPAVRPESLIISEAEIRFMQEISILIGDSPRTIKRYINIYRIIRTHHTFSFVDNNESEHYYAAMLMLALMTGFPNSVKPFFEKICLSNGDKYFDLFLEENLSFINSNMPQLVTLSKLIHEKEKADSIGLLSSIKIDIFKKNLDLISRFSFRNIN